MKNIHLGCGLISNKINLLIISSPLDPYLDTIIKAIPLKHKHYAKDRVEFIKSMDIITMGHINDGLLLIIPKNFRLTSDVSKKHISYINKVMLRSDTDWHGNFTDRYYITHGKNQFQSTSGEIADTIKQKSRLHKINNIKQNTVKQVIIDYTVTVNEHQEPFKLTVDENLLGMSWEDYIKLDIEDRNKLILKLYEADMVNRIKPELLQVTDNVYDKTIT